MMPLEIELKFPVQSFESVETELAKRDVVFGPAVHQVDQYFAHQLRDFAETDEALRLRRLAHRCQVTYKGPKLDQLSKTRREIEFTVGVEDADNVEQLFKELGFHPVAIVKKHRRHAAVTWNAISVTVALDTVENVGLFVELEVVATTGDFEPIRQELFRLSASLNLVDTERRSYLELLLLRGG
jgi:adenylate cyclase class 2